MAVRRRRKTSRKAEIDLVETMREALKNPVRKLIIDLLYERGQVSVMEIYPDVMEKYFEAGKKPPYPYVVYRFLEGLERVGIARSKIVMVQRDAWRKMRLWSLTEEARKLYEEIKKKNLA